MSPIVAITGQMNDIMSNEEFKYDLTIKLKAINDN